MCRSPEHDILASKGTFTDHFRIIYGWVMQLVRRNKQNMLYSLLIPLLSLVLAW